MRNKSIKIIRQILICIATYLFPLSILISQNIANSPASGIWNSSSETMPGSIKAFEENKGQYVNPMNDEKVLFGCFHHGVNILFTEKGLTYLVKHVYMRDGSSVAPLEGENEKSWERRTERELKVEYHYLTINWENANPHPRIIGVEETPFYFSGGGLDHIKGFRKIIYEDVYPGINVVFEFHKQQGIKYSIIVKPEADPSVFTMNYSGHKGLQFDEKGNLHIASAFGDYIDHAPVSYQNGKQIHSSFKKINDWQIKFNLDAFDPSRELIIDPWMLAPTTGGFAPVNVGVDASNNVYIFGAYQATSPWDIRQYVQKYNAAGTLLWQYYLLEYQGGNGDYWISDLVVSPAGDCYIATQYQVSGRGICPNNQQYGMVSLNASGGRTYFNCPTPNASAIFETWNLAYSCNYTTLVQGGCTINTANSTQAAIMNPANGQLGAVAVDHTIGEIYAGTVAPNGNYYALAADSNINPTTYTTTTGPHNKVLCYNITGSTISLAWWYPAGYSYVDFNSKMPKSLGTNGIVGGCNYLYTSDGVNLDQRNLTNGALIKRITIPGGTVSRPNVNSGIAVDLLCGYVYAGTKGAVYYYDENLNSLGSQSVGANNIVFDVKFNNGIISYCGATNS
ncbi:MAG: hypothetical protein PHD97_11555, partial [Bacteroidales bacterium]|nr:hypothetical protein [Bacteroidales bacterium]